MQAVLASPDDSDEIVKGTKVTLTCTTRDATIYYTTNDSTPEPYKSPVYSSPIQIDEDTVIRAIAEKDGMQSAEAVYDYEVAGTLKKPSSSLDSGSVVYKGTRIRLSGKETIAYTVDGSDPKAILKEDDKKDSSGGGTTITVTTGEKEKDDQVLYGENVVIDADFGESVTVTAFCYGGGKTPSETSTFTYTICEKEDYLTAVPPAGSVLRPDDSVTLTTSLTDGMIFYTVGGDAPDVRSSGSSYRHSARGDAVEGSTVPVEGEPGSTFTIRATAVQDGGDGGTTVVFSYQIAERTPAPTASIPSGAVTLDGAAVVLTVKEGDIFYTTDGARPDHLQHPLHRPHLRHRLDGAQGRRRRGGQGAQRDRPVRLHPRRPDGRAGDERAGRRDRAGHQGGAENRDARRGHLLHDRRHRAHRAEHDLHRPGDHHAAGDPQGEGGAARTPRQRGERRHLHRLRTGKAGNRKRSR